MLKATFTESSEKLSLRLEGHAGYAEIGKDLVCSSASILAYTLASIVEQFGVDVNINLESGNATIECRCTASPMTDTIREAFHFAKVGYALLEHNYPQYVRLMES